MTGIIPDEYLPDYMRSRRPVRAAITNTVEQPSPAPADLRDVIFQVIGSDIAETTAQAILQMIKVGGSASVIPNPSVPKGMIVITCHPEVDAHVRRLADEAVAGLSEEHP